MNNDNINIYEDDFSEGFEDIEQMLKPQCEFKASDTLKEEVLRKAKDEVAASRSINMWNWIAAACVAGVLILFLMPPKTNQEVVENTQIVAMVEPQATNQATISYQAEETSKDESVKEADMYQKQSKATIEIATAVSQPTEEAEPEEEPVQMSEETRMELLMACLSPEVQMPMEFDPEEEIRQMRMRGERMLSQMKTE